MPDLDRLTKEEVDRLLRQIRYCRLNPIRRRFTFPSVSLMAIYLVLMGGYIVAHLWSWLERMP